MEHFQFGICFTYRIWQPCMFSVTEDSVVCFKSFNYVWTQEWITPAHYSAWLPTVWLGV